MLLARISHQDHGSRRRSNPVTWMKRSVIRDFSATFNIPGFHCVASRLRECEARTPGMSFLLVTFLWTSKDKFIGNEFVLGSRLDKFDRIIFEQPMAGPQGENPWMGGVTADHTDVI